MKLTNLTFLAAALTCTVNSFLVPTNQPDGFYSVQIDKNGTAIGKPVLLSPKTEPKKSAHKGRTEIVARGFPGADVGCNYDISGIEYFAAASNYACNDQWIQPWSVFYNTWGSSVVYMCNYGGWNPCRGNEFRDAMSIVGTACGSSRAGWVSIPSWKKAYGRANTGTQICF